MNTYEIFDKMKKFILSPQGKNNIGGGIYHDTNGIPTCPVGVLISREHYNSNIEELNVCDSRVTRALTRSLGRHLTQKEKLLLQTVQGYYDARQRNHFFTEKELDDIYADVSAATDIPQTK